MSSQPRVLQSIFWLASSKAIIQALSLVSTIAVARILDPADYGLMAIASLLISVSGMVSEFGAGSAIIQFRDLERRELNGIFWLTIGLSVMVYLLLCAAAPPIAYWFGRPELVSVLRVAGLALPLSTLRVVPENLLRREMRFDRIAVANVAAACLAIPAVFLLAMSGAGVWALVASAVVMVVVQTASMFISTRWAPGTDVGTSRLGVCRTNEVKLYV
jgi:O-antigen/teichoic acid export membrane protein